MVKENIFGKFITKFTKFIKNVQEKCENTQSGFLTRYVKNILKVIGYSFVICCFLAFCVLMVFCGIGTFALFFSIVRGDPAFQWYYAAAPIVGVLCIALLMTFEKDDQY